MDGDKTNQQEPMGMMFRFPQGIRLLLLFIFLILLFLFGAAILERCHIGTTKIRNPKPLVAVLVVLMVFLCMALWDWLGQSGF